MIHPDSTNPYFNSRYASLPALQATVLPLVHGAGCVLSYTTETNPWRMRCSLTHADSASTVSAEVPLIIPVDASPQQAASAITYARRYALSCLLSLSVDPDDDAETAESRNKSTVTTPVARSVAPATPVARPVAPAAPVAPVAKPVAKPTAQAYTRPIPDGAITVDCRLLGRVEKLKDGVGKTGRPWTLYAVAMDAETVGEISAKTFDDVVAAQGEIPGPASVTLVEKSFRGKSEYEIAALTPKAATEDEIPF